MAARPQVISDSETGALVVDDMSVAKAFSILESLHGTLSEIEDEGELLKALRELGSEILNTEELLIDWAMKRWSPCVSILESSPAGWVTDEAAAPSDTKQIPFAHLLGQFVRYTGETSCLHNGHTLLNGQVCTVEEVTVNKMKLYARGIGAFWTSFQSWSLSGPSESSSEPSFGVFRNSKCLTCLSPSALYKKKGDKICSKCEEQLSEYWSDEAMEVIIHRNSEFVGTAEESWTSLKAYTRGCDNSWVLRVVFKFYKGDTVQEYHHPGGGRKFDIAERVRQRKNHKNYRTAMNKIKEDRRKKESKEKKTTMSGSCSSQVFGNSSASLSGGELFAWTGWSTTCTGWNTTWTGWNTTCTGWNGGQSSWYGGESPPWPAGQASFTWAPTWTLSVIGSPPGLSPLADNMATVWPTDGLTPPRRPPAHVETRRPENDPIKSPDEVVSPLELLQRVQQGDHLALASAPTEVIQQIISSVSLASLTATSSASIPEPLQLSAPSSVQPQIEQEQPVHQSSQAAEAEYKEMTDLPNALIQADRKNDISTVEGKPRNDVQDQRDTDEKLDCSICMAEKKEYMCKPCNHICLCRSCKDKGFRNCPMCREVVVDIEKVFL